MNIEKPSDISGSFSVYRYHRNDFILLIRSELWMTTSNAAQLTSQGSQGFILRIPFGLRATGLTNRGTLEAAQRIAGHRRLVDHVPSTFVRAG